MAVALACQLSHLDGERQGARERLEAAFDGAALGQGVKLLLGAFDLVGGRLVEVVVEGVVDHVLAEADQLAAQEVVVG